MSQIINFGQFSTPVTGEAIVNETVYDLLLSINPLPGVMVGWYDVYEQFRVSKFIPYNTPGVLLTINIFFAFLYYWCLGIYFSFLGYSLIDYIKRNKIIRAGIVLTLAFSIIFMETQYKLRSTTRLIYYLIFIQVFTNLIFDKKWKIK
jgi:hypothetical protein